MGSIRSIVSIREASVADTTPCSHPENEDAGRDQDEEENENGNGNEGQNRTHAHLPSSGRIKSNSTVKRTRNLRILLPRGRLSGQTKLNLELS